MGKAFQIIGGRVTNAGATITALTANTGDSFTVRSFPMESYAWLENIWAQEATTGVVRVRSPRLHDAVQGIRLRVSASGRFLLPRPAEQRLYAQDVLTFELSGGGAETDAAFIAVYYEDLPGVDARLATWDEIAPRIVNVAGVEQAITTGGTASDWGGSQAINADFDQFKRNVDYALLGYTSDIALGAIGVTGPDTGNLRVGGPGALNPEFSSEWFVHLSRLQGRGHIPIINGANCGATTFDVSHTATATAANVTLILAELAGPSGR